MCSLRGDCSWAILNNSAISPIALLRLLRFFRIMWILKHVKMMRFATLLGGLAVGVLYLGGGLRGVAGWWGCRTQLQCMHVGPHDLLRVHASQCHVPHAQPPGADPACMHACMCRMTCTPSCPC
jgi:hypothetical protein